MQAIAPKLDHEQQRQVTHEPLGPDAGPAAEFSSGPASAKSASLPLHELSLADDDDDDDDDDFDHDLRAGDHICRWTYIAIYPIQIHGIVLSAGPGIITLVDFGASSQSADRMGPPDAATGREETAGRDDGEAQRVGQAAIEGGIQGDQRLEILTVTDPDLIKRWKKINYGTKIKKGKLKRLFSSIMGGGEKKEKKAEAKASAGKGGKISLVSSDGTTATAEALSAEDRGEGGDAAAKTTAAAPGEEPNELPQLSPSMPDSDPNDVVLGRVRYLLEHEEVEKEGNGKGKHSNRVLPPYHLFYANSECIAVWCKTGRFSTLQASFFLQTTALGQAKTAATVSLYMAGQTVAMSVPAGGVLGWFGATTTATVPLLSAQPWLIPALAGYGIAAVGTPYIVLMKARGQWEVSTMTLNDGFWAWAGPEVYVAAIHSWSGLARPSERRQLPVR